MQDQMNRLFMAWIIVVSLFASAAVSAATVLKDISFAALPGSKVELVLKADGRILDPVSFTTDNPARIAIDLAGVKLGLKKKTQKVGIGLVSSVSAVEAGNRTRVVINLADSAPYTLVADGNVIRVTVGASGKGSAAIVSSARKSRPGSSKSTRNRVKNVDFNRGPRGEGRVIIRLNREDVVTDLREEGGKVVLDLLNTTLPNALANKLDVTDFATPVQSVALRQRGNAAQVVITAKGNYEHLAYQAGNEYTIEFRPLSKAEKTRLQKERLTYSGDRLSLNFQDIPVRSVLQLLADFTGLNMVVSDTVGGSITLRLKNVPWDQALDIILKTKGLSKRQTDNVIMIAPTEEIAAREQLELESQKQIEELAPLHSDLIQVNYGKASDFAELLKAEENQLMSPRGSVTVDTRTNTLLIRDTNAQLESIRQLIGKLDIPVRQVMIESRIVIANDDFARDIGVRFGLKSNTKIGGDNEAMIAGGLPGHISDFGVDAGQFMGVHTGIENPAGSGNEALMVNLPQTLSPGRGGAVNLLLGKVGSYLLNLELSAMQQEGKGEIVSSPRVITADQHKATIKQGVEIPYQQSSSSGATNVAFKEAVLKLEVTPHITPDDRIKMDLIVRKDNPDFARAVLGVPPVNTRSVETSVLVENGETIVLGGVFERNRSKSVERVPFFGELPYVGAMFRQTQRKDENSELLLFVTPSIIKSGLSVVR